MRMLCKYDIWFEKEVINEAEQFKHFLEKEQDYWRERLDLDRFSTVPYFQFDESFPIPGTEYVAWCRFAGPAAAWHRAESWLEDHVKFGYEIKKREKNRGEN